MDTMIIDNVKILPKGQIIIPQNMRDKLKLSVGDEVALVCEDGRLIIENPIIAAMRKLQKAMEGEFEKAGLYSDDDIVDLIMEMRREEERQINI